MHAAYPAVLPCGAAQLGQQVVLAGLVRARKRLCIGNRKGENLSEKENLLTCKDLT